MKDQLNISSRAMLVIGAFFLPLSYWVAVYCKIISNYNRTGNEYKNTPLVTVRVMCSTDNSPQLRGVKWEEKTCPFTEPSGKEACILMPKYFLIYPYSSTGCDSIRETNYGAGCIKLFIPFGNKSYFCNTTSHFLGNFTPEKHFWRLKLVN